MTASFSGRPPDPSVTANGAHSSAVPPPGCPAHAAVHAAGRPAADGPTALYGAEANADPMATYQRLREAHGPVAPILLEGDVPAWLVLGYEENLQVARAPRRFTRDTREWRDFQEGLIPEDSPIMPMVGWHADCRCHDGREHQRLRSAVNESLDRFDRRGVRRQINRQANLLVDRFSAAGTAELLSQFAQQLPMLVLTRLLGLPQEQGPQLVEASRQLIQGTEKAVTANQYIVDTLRALVRRKHRVPDLDLASWLIEHPTGLSDDEVESHLRLLLVAANETTTNLMASTLKMLLTDPRCRGSIRGGQMSLPAAIEQSLWDEPPLAVCPARVATYDMELAGQSIRKGDLLLLGLAAGNADPEIRPSSDTPMYGNRSHLAFSGGPHECPGQDIGRAIADGGIGILLKRLPDLRLVIDAEELTWTSSTWSRHLDRLPVEFTARQPISGTPQPQQPSALSGTPAEPTADQPSSWAARWSAWRRKPVGR